MNDELERLMREATPGPWKACPGKHAVWVTASDCHVYSNVDRADSPHHPDTIQRWKADAALIAAAVNALPELLERVKRYERLIRAMIENEPDDIVADGGHTVLDEWRYNARAALTQEGGE